MINLIFWLIYYLKCAFNLLYSYFSKINIVQIKSTKFKVNNSLYIVKLYGSYFEMGKQYGKLMKNILIKDINLYIDFIKKNQINFIKKIPLKYRNNNIFKSLNLLFNDNKKYFNIDVINFMKGISKSSEIKLNKLIYVNMFSDLMDNHCILLSKNINNNIINLRTLDYGTPQLVQTLFVFNPTNKISYISLNISVLIGVFTGISKNNIFFGESYYDFKIGELSYIGIPFHHISHQILSESKNIKDAENILKNCKRKSNLQLLISDKKTSKIYLSSIDKFVVQQEGNLVYSVTPNEKANFDKNFHYLNNIDNIIKKFVPKTKSGELHIMISYNDKLYVSVTTNLLQSYNNTFYEFTLKDLFN